MIFTAQTHTALSNSQQKNSINQYDGDWETILLLRYRIARTISAAVKVSYQARSINGAETPAIHVIAGSFGLASRFNPRR